MLVPHGGPRGVGVLSGVRYSIGPTVVIGGRRWTLSETPMYRGVSLIRKLLPLGPY